MTDHLQSILCIYSIFIYRIKFLWVNFTYRIYLFSRLDLCGWRKRVENVRKYSEDVLVGREKEAERFSRGPQHANLTLEYSQHMLSFFGIRQRIFFGFERVLERERVENALLVFFFPFFFFFSSESSGGGPPHLTISTVGHGDREPSWRR